MELKQREIIEQYGVEEIRPGALYLTYANRDGVESIKIHDNLPGVGVAVRVNREILSKLAQYLLSLNRQLGGIEWHSSELK